MGAVKNTINLEHEIPFDQYSRQYQVHAILDTVRKKNERLNILDVGGHKGRTEDFLVDDDVTVMDLYTIKKKNYVKGSALDMPFVDKSFDYVVSFDVLEHIPSEKRKKFFDECFRVARKGVIVCAPHKTNMNEAAEKSLNALYKRMHGKQHQWLKEHIEYGIPDFDIFDTYAQSKKFFTARFRSNKTHIWLSMQQAIFVNSKFPIASETIMKMNEYYNNHFPFDGAVVENETYRLILCCFRSEEDMKKVAATVNIKTKLISPEQEADVYDVIANYFLTLTEKTNMLAENYKELHAFEKKRADKLQRHNEALLNELYVTTAKLDKIKNSIYYKTYRLIKGSKNTHEENN